MKTTAKIMACLGGLFLVLGAVLFLSGERLELFPRSDTAPWGFAVLGAVYLLGAVGIFLAEREKGAQTDRPSAAQGKAALLAFIAQTLLLFTAVILLIFTGYLNTVSAFTLMAVLIISVVVFTAARILYRR